MITPPTDEKKIKGTWTTPDNPHEWVSGILTYSIAGRPALEVSSALYNPYLEQKYNDRLSTIIGITPQGTYTLVDCRLVGESIGEGVSIQNFAPTHTLLNSEITDVSELTFETITFTLSGLNYWLNTHGFKRSIKDGVSILEFTMPPSIGLQLEGRFWIDIDFAIQHLQGGDRFGVHDYQYSSITFRYHPEKPLVEILKDVETFKQFVAFCTLSDNYAYDISVSAPLKQIPRVPYIFHNKSYIAKPFSMPIKNQLVPLDSMGVNFPNILKVWYDLYEDERKRYCIELFQRSISTNKGIITLLDVIRGLEAFSRNVIEFSPHTSEQFKILRERLAAKLTADEEIFRQVITTANEYNLKTRIIHLVNVYLAEDQNITLLASATSIDEFAKRLTDTRNFHAHFGEKKKAFEGDDISIALDDALVIFACCICKYLGATDIKHQAGAIRLFI